MKQLAQTLKQRAAQAAWSKKIPEQQKASIEKRKAQRKPNKGLA